MSIQRNVAQQNAEVLSDAMTDFSKLKLRTFEHPELGVKFNIPHSWKVAQSPQRIQISDPEHQARIIVDTAPPAPNLELWAAACQTKVKTALPMLRELGPAYELPVSDGLGIAMEFEGVDQSQLSRRLVLAVQTDRQALTITLVANAQVFQEQEALYRWLLDQQLSIFGFEVAPDIEDEPEQDFEQAAKGHFKMRLALALYIGVWLGTWLGPTPRHAFMMRASQFDPAMGLLILQVGLTILALIGVWQLSSGMGYPRLARILLLIGALLPGVNIALMIYLCFNTNLAIFEAGYETGKFFTPIARLRYSANKLKS